ncbi:DUF885 domain-containing protein [Exilibacterium tricleocarpae]|uniref:DUF885 domain-containing protein n=1 Tax=Exilibacterium tricleocarpae TaxID=2591008 RepID=A0A545SY51_9GAMM|nr:DUF885 domain-containing protein [Exilibacterium tricleocarpae]TQV69892.1 DUF885 domain-containing protein [Exilibacterium tricleocarpae]
MGKLAKPLCCFLLCITAATASADLSRLATEVAAIKSGNAFKHPDERLTALLDLVYDYQMTEFPEQATRHGYPGQNHRWTDYSLAAIERRQREVRELLALLERIPMAQLSPAAQLDYQLLQNELEMNVAAQAFPDHLLPLNQMGGVQQLVAQVLGYTAPQSERDYEDMLSRLQRVPELVDQHLALLRRGLQEGITPPKITLRDVPQQVRNLLVKEPLNSPLLAAFKQYPQGMSARQQRQLTEKARRAFAEQVTPAYEKLLQFLEDEYLPGAREPVGLSALPNGTRWYAHRAARSTTTELTPQQIHAKGLQEVKRIRRAMDEIIKQTGFRGDFAAFARFLRTDPQFYYDSKEELLRSYRDISKRADPELVKLFGVLPRLPYGVEPIPAYAEKSQTTAYYRPGSPEAGRAGVFFANTYNLKSRPKWEMEALSLHEAVPGHHLQIALAQEQQGMHPWRRQLLHITAYVEGWGLYSESLGEDMGFYRDPYSKFGQLTYEMWRAIRLVVDTGMHQLGWSRQRAIDFFIANSAKTEHDIAVEIDRYIVWPGQALAYKIGELKIKELREYAQGELGEAFDIRAFHDLVLESGPVPLSILEARVRAWVASG